MTNRDGETLYEQRVSTPAGAQAQAAAGLAFQVTRLLGLALRRSGLTQHDLASRLAVTEGRVSQVINGDGNVHVATLARFMHALGYTVELRAVSPDSGRAPIEPQRGRRGNSGKHVSVYQQKFLTANGPVDVTMWMPTDDVLGCVAHGTLEHVGQFPVTAQGWAPQTRVHSATASAWRARSVKKSIGELAAHGD